jgi:hypothetical protein
MKNNPLEKSINNALRTNDALASIFAMIGNSDHPRGVIPTSYRNARRALSQAIKENNLNRAVNEIFDQLYFTLQIKLDEILRVSSTEGINSAVKQLSNYGIKPSSDNVLIGLSSQGVSEATNAVLSVVEQQKTIAQTVLALGQDPTAIIGDTNRVGILRPGDAIVTAVHWASSLLTSNWGNTVSKMSNQDKSRIGKMAVAAINSRTTDCCLKVHGQTVAFDDKFNLTGTPRYMDEMDWSPFHHYCRTSITLYYPEYDDGITQSMREEARAEITKRELKGSSPTKIKRTYSKLPTKPLTPYEIIDKWVHGSWGRIPTNFKEAIRREFGLDAMVYNRNGVPLNRNLIKSMQPQARAMYNATQAYFKEQGLTHIKLYRGLKGGIDAFSVAESWTADYATALKFDGFDVLEMVIPVNRILISYNAPGWHNGKYGNQFEFIVMPEAPK